VRRRSTSPTSWTSIQQCSNVFSQFLCVVSVATSSISCCVVSVATFSVSSVLVHCSGCVRGLSTLPTSWTSIQQCSNVFSQFLCVVQVVRVTTSSVSSCALCSGCVRSRSTSLTSWNATCRRYTTAIASSATSVATSRTAGPR